MMHKILKQLKAEGSEELVNLVWSNNLYLKSGPIKHLLLFLWKTYYSLIRIMHFEFINLNKNCLPVSFIKFQIRKKF